MTSSPANDDSPEYHYRSIPVVDLDEETSGSGGPETSTSINQASSCEKYKGSSNLRDTEHSTRTLTLRAHVNNFLQSRASSKGESDPSLGWTDSHATFTSNSQIVIFDESQRTYGETILQIMKERKLVTSSFMYPRGEISVKEFVKSVSNLGVTFAVVVNDGCEEAKILDFYQLRGEIRPQYYKNWPMLRAVDFMVNKLEELRQANKTKLGVPDNITDLMGKVVENDVLQPKEYDALITYFQERRIRQNNMVLNKVINGNITKSEK